MDRAYDAAVNASWSARAVCLGCLLGALLAAGNAFTALKIGYLDGGSIAAAIVGHALARRFGRPATLAETNLTQTIAASAAMTAGALGLSGSLPALEMLNVRLPAATVLLWGLSLCAMGILLGATLRRRLIVEERLAFPTGTATAEVIRALHGHGAAVVARGRWLLGAFAVAAGITWFRDGRPAVIPAESRLLPASVGASPAIAWSPLLLATGALIGPRAATSILLGTLAGWGLLARWPPAAGTVAFEDATTLLVWPGVGVMLGAMGTALALDWRRVGRGVLDAVAAVRPSGGASGRSAALWAAAVGLFVVSGLLVGMPLAGLLLGLLLMWILGAVAARVTGETDQAPLGAIGQLAQMVLGSVLPMPAATNVFLAATAANSAAQTSQTLWALKAGHLLGAPPHLQLRGQLLGSVVGAAVSLPVYAFLVRAHGVGSTVLPAPFARAWKAVADLVERRDLALPASVVVATWIAAATGAALAAGERLPRLRGFLPAASGLGIGFLLPTKYSVSIFVGGALAWILARSRPEWCAERLSAITAGGMAGEALAGLLVAALTAAGWLGG